MIRTIKSASNLSEMLFLCQEYRILPVLTDSLYLGMTLARVLKAQSSATNIALFDSNTLLEIVSYDTDAELLPYLKERQFTCGYRLDSEGRGIKIE